jgi:hypothetical protein
MSSSISPLRARYDGCFRGKDSLGVASVLDHFRIGEHVGRGIEQVHPAEKGPPEHWVLGRPGGDTPDKVAALHFVPIPLRRRLSPPSVDSEAIVSGGLPVNLVRLRADPRLVRLQRVAKI